jgi:serine protease AprX
MNSPNSVRSRIRKKAVWGLKPAFAAFIAVAMTLASASASAKGNHRLHGHAGRTGRPNRFVDKEYRLDGELTRRYSRNSSHVSSVIVELKAGAQVPREFQSFVRGNRLDLINGVVLQLPDSMLKKLADHDDVFRVHEDRPIGTHNYRTSVTVGATTVRQTMGLTGSGIGIAVIDSGVASWHDDLTNNSTKLYPYGNQRVAKFVDFVNGRTLPYDDNGHGTHVSGIIAGNGYDSLGEKAGIAPSASIISLKVLDANGSGSISRIIAALSWVATNAKTYNIRVVNMSVGANIRESYFTDPLTLAVKKVTDLGITVVCAAGNIGKNAAGQEQFGGITAPANAPWVLTVGASSTNGTLTRGDDTLGDYSSRGPTAIDFLAKPDLVAPGTGTISLAAPGSTFYTTKPQYLLAGLLGSARPYLALTGTSMAAPVVSGTVALMLQANPNLTPNLIKAILQYTAQEYPGYKPLEQGAGFLNTYGAVKLAKFYATHKVGDHIPTQTTWSKHIIWGNHMLKGGYLNPLGNAWGANIVWGTAKTLGDIGDNIVWGTDCGSGGCDNIVWGTADNSGDNIVWGTAVRLLNTLNAVDNIVWGTAGDGDNIVWGTADAADNIVWGTDCGGADCDNIVWGTSDVDNIVWGTADAADNIVWGTSGLDNIVWGTSADQDVTWGTAGDDAPLFSDDATGPLPDVAVEFGDISVTAVQ